MLKKYLKNLCTKDYIPFSITIILSITCSLDSDNNVNITENKRKALDVGNIGCGVFVDLQKAFDIVDNQILSAKLNYYGIRVFFFFFFYTRHK